MGNGSKILDASAAVSIFRIAQNSPQLVLPLLPSKREIERIFEKEKKINYFQTREVAADSKLKMEEQLKSNNRDRRGLVVGKILELFCNYGGRKRVKRRRYEKWRIMAFSQTETTHKRRGGTIIIRFWRERGREKGEGKRREKGRDASHHPPDASGIEKKTSRSVGCDDCYCSPRGLPSRNTPPSFPDFSRQRKSRLFLSRFSRFSKPGKRDI